MWCIYVLLCHDNSLYTGITKNLTKRFLTHLKGKGAAYTRSHCPVCVLYTKRVRSKSTALKREAQIKSWSRIKKIKTLHLF